MLILVILILFENVYFKYVFKYTSVDLWNLGREILNITIPNTL